MSLFKRIGLDSHAERVTFCITEKLFNNLSDRCQIRISNDLELFSVDGEVVDGPEEAVPTGLSDPDKLGFDGIKLDLSKRIVAFAFGDGFAPFFSVLGNLDLVAAGVVTS